MNNDPWARPEPDTAPTVPAQPVTPPTGWYPDPADAQRQRFWDGTSWTAETRPLNPEPAAPQPLYPATPAYGQNTPGYPAQAPAAPDAPDAQPQYDASSQPPYGTPAPSAYSTPAPGAYSAPAQPSTPAAPTYPPAGSLPWNAAPAPGHAAPAPIATASPAYPPAGSNGYTGTPAPGMPVASTPPVYPGAGSNGYMGTPAPGGYNPSAMTVGPKTADGVPLAGWWWRVLASLVDSAILGIVYGAILIPTLFRSMLNATTSDTDTTTLFSQIGTDEAKFSLLFAVIMLVYALIMLCWKGATLGQLICRLRVVPIGQGQRQGGLPVAKALSRVIAYFVLCNGLGAMFLLVGATGLSGVWSLVGLLDVLWALWDPKKQTLHDKIASTQVIRLP